MLRHLPGAGLPKVQTSTELRKQINKAISELTGLAQQTPADHMKPAEQTAWQEQTAVYKRTIGQIRAMEQRLTTFELRGRGIDDGWRPLDEIAVVSQEIVKPQDPLQMEARQFTQVSNLVKARYDAAKSVINNVR